MRRNRFNEYYCHSGAEAVLVMNEADISPDEVYGQPCLSAPGEKATIEIVRNDNGETVLYLEADTQAQVRAYAKDVGLEIIE